MTARSKAVIKSYFTTGLRPTQSQFVDLIDSYADVSAAASLPTVVSADSSKVLQVSPTGTGLIWGAKLPAFTANKFGAIVVQNTADDGFDYITSQGTSGQVLTSNGADALPSFQTISSTNKITTYQFTDATDTACNVISTHANIGTATSITIPTKGIIGLEFYGIPLATTILQYWILGIRIGSTNYWPTNTRGNGAGTDYAVSGAIDFGAAGTSDSGGVSMAISGQAAQYQARLNIQRLGIPTGAQTVQPIIARYPTGGGSSGTLTMKGTTSTSLFHITVEDYN